MEGRGFRPTIHGPFSSDLTEKWLLRCYVPMENGTSALNADYAPAGRGAEPR